MSLSMKPSGVVWVPEIPAHWAVKKLGYLASLKSGEAITADEITDDGPYPVYGGNGLRGYSDRFTHDGQYVLIGRQGALCGNINYAKGRFWASEHAVVVTPREELVVRWLGELLRAMDLNQYSASAAQPGLAVETIAELRVPIPPIEEQMAIANYLDHEISRIDSLISSKERLLGLLVEKRRALITRIVTEGLNPNMPLRDSGIPWLGPIPAHWTVKRLKYLGKALIGLTFNPSDIVPDDRGLLVLRASNVRNQKIVLEDNVYVSMDIPSELITRFGDILICSRSGSRALVGKSAQIDERSAGLTFGTFMTVFRSTFNDYLFLIFNSPLFDYQAGAFSTSTINQLTIDTLKNLEVPVPPHREQRVIVDYLNVETEKFDRLIDETQDSIDLITERRNALTIAAVTGHVQVA